MLTNSSSSLDTNLPFPAIDTYKENAARILYEIDHQFIQAIYDVNATALQSGEYSIFYHTVRTHHKGSVREGDEFKGLNRYLVSIIKGPPKEYDTPFHTYENDALFLGAISPSPNTEEQLKVMAETGNIPSFEETIYTHWFKELSKEITFFNQNHAQVMAAKDRINEQFLNIIRETHNYIAEHQFKPIGINAANWPFHKPPLEDNKFEPLKSYNIWKIENDGQTAIPMGRITIIKDRDQFRKLVTRSTPEAFDEIFIRCSKEMKEMVDRSNASFSNLCSALTRGIKKKILSILPAQESSTPATS